jgi:hypothetical protein
MHSIFVQIASYRDPELLPTLRDIIAKSSGLNKITFGLVWQKDDSESIGEFADNKNLRVIDVPWYQSKGLGWARQLTQSLYSGEDYTLQLDSHHRFKQDWDQILIDMIKSLSDESKKPILTSYAQTYDPTTNAILGNAPCRILPHDFKVGGTIWFNPTIIPRYNTLSKPIRARFVSGHFFFVRGDHCKEYKYDPDMYFAGDEITLSARCYTLGYDLYHPHVNVIYHHYGRKNLPKHWVDHNEKNKIIYGIEKSWGQRDAYSKKRIRQLLGEEDNGIDLGEFGLGKERSIDDYARYAGLDFKNKRILKQAIDGYDPPIILESEEAWNNGFKKDTLISLKEWPRESYLANRQNIEKVDITLFNLQKKIIHQSSMSMADIENNQILTISLLSDYVPMKIILDPIIKNSNQKMIWERDLRRNIHWA